MSRKPPRASSLSPSRSLPAVQRFRLDRIIAPGSCGGSGESYFPNILRLLQDVHKTQHKTELDVSEQYASARAHTPPLPPPAHAFSSPARSFSSATPHAPPSLRRRRSVSFRSRTPQQRWYDGTREPAVRGRDPSSCNCNGVRRLHGAHGRVPRTRDFVLDFTLGSIMSYERDRLTLWSCSTESYWTERADSGARPESFRCVHFLLFSDFKTISHTFCYVCTVEGI